MGYFPGQREHWLQMQGPLQSPESSVGLIKMTVILSLTRRRFNQATESPSLHTVYNTRMVYLFQPNQMSQFLHHVQIIHGWSQDIMGAEVNIYTLQVGKIMAEATSVCGQKSRDK